MAEPEEADAVAADGHWSQVAPREQFTLTLQFDESFQQQTVIARPGESCCPKKKGKAKA